MMLSLTRALALGIALAGAAPTNARADACPCATPALAEAVSQATVIFVGKVLAVTTDLGSQSMILENGQWRSAPGDVSVTRVTMQVETLLKGRQIEKSVIVSTPSVCGYPLAPGATYLVFAALNPSGLWTDACKGNASGQAVAAKMAEVRRVVGTHPQR